MDFDINAAFDLIVYAISLIVGVSATFFGFILARKGEENTVKA